MISASGNSSRRSLLNRWHAEHGARFNENDVRFVEHYGDPDAESSGSRRLGLCDLSLLPRAGMTGPASREVLRQSGVDIPPVPNRAIRQANGDLVARLSAEEYLHVSLSLLRNANLQPAVAGWRADAGQRAYGLPRSDSHSLFSLCGHAAAGVLAKLCAVDCRRGTFAAGAVAQTSIARQSGIIIRHDFGATLNFLLLTATPATEYLWQSLLDAQSEYGGVPVGIAAIRILNNDPENPDTDS